MSRVWRSEDALLESILSFHNVGLRIELRLSRTIITVVLCLNFFFFYRLFETGNCSSIGDSGTQDIAQAGLELSIFLPQ